MEDRRRVASYVILLMVFVDLLGFGILLPLMPLYARDFGASELVVGLLMATAAAIGFVCAPLWGRVSDRFGRRPVVLATLVGSTLSYALFGYAHSLAWLFAARVVVGLSGATAAVAQAYMADLSPPERRAEAMGRLGAAVGAGIVIGPLLASVLVQFGRGVPGYVASGIAFVGLVLATIFLPESRTDWPASQEPPRASFASVRPALPLIGFFGLLHVGQSGVFNMYALYMQDRLSFGPSKSSLVLASFGALMALTQGTVVRRAVGRLGEGRTFLVAAALLMVGHASLVFVHSVWPLFLLVPCQALGAGLANPSLLSLVSRAAPAEQQGWVLGVNQSAGGLARVIGPVWGGYTFQTFGPAGPFVTASAICAALLAAGFSRLRPSRATIPSGGTLE